MGAFAIVRSSTFVQQGYKAEQTFIGIPKAWGSWRRFAVADWASVCSCTATAFVSCLFLDVSIFQNNKQSGACKLPIYYIYARWTTLQAHCHDAAVLYYHYLIYK